ncbi:unnamed protein product [Lactuca saligna]|uniref:Uncharacterized protein n=1 Tax=Lactuca saligna TaxID=75948 RepID=A0AA35ZLC0_LACSI|nr:unnamed protein product [Lactuca saligna]
MESKIMNALAVRTEKVKVIIIKLENTDKQVNDLLSEKSAMKSYITDVPSMHSDIIETRDSTVTIRKHLAEKLRHVFAMLHRLEAKLIVKGESEPKGKEKLFSKEPTIDHSEDEEPDENEHKRRKAREAEMDEHQRIVLEDEVK